MFPDPEPFTTEQTGNYHDGRNTPEQSGVVPQAEEYQPPICATCNAPADEWDTHCERCGHPMTTWGILRDMALVEQARDRRAA